MTKPMSDAFSRAAHWTAAQCGRAHTFMAALLVVLAWAVTGPLFRYSDTWQLVINTGTTIVTFLMVFLIQNTQNRDGQALQTKLDELIRATKGADDEFMGIEKLTDKELEALHSSCEAKAHRAREVLEKTQAERDRRTGRKPVETTHRQLSPH